MILNAKSESIELSDSHMDFITFGKGRKKLILIPGLGESITNIKGKSFAVASQYRKLAKKFKIYIFSRKKNLPQKYSTQEMAKDQIEAMEILGIDSADIVGISQGGMIAQYMAIDYPEFVNKLVLTVTLSRINKTVESIIQKWIFLAQDGDYESLMKDTLEKSYTPKKLKYYKILYPIILKFGKPNDFSRFITQANSCLTHNAYNELDKISAKTLIIGGEKDKVVGNLASSEIAEKIKNSKLMIYENLGHALYEEAKDFQDVLLNFFE